MEFVDKINELKQIVQSYQSSSLSTTTTTTLTDTAYKRFLVGSKGNVEQASTKMITYLQWRDIEKPDDLNLNDNDIKNEYEKQYSYIYKKDNKDRPVIYVQGNKYDRTNRIVNNVKKFVIWEIEQALKLAKDDEEKIVVLIDLSGFTIARTMDYEVVKTFINILQNNYDEILGTGIIINSPWIFSACWNIIKPWLDPDTALKIRFMNPVEVSEIIPIENQPEFVLSYWRPATATTTRTTATTTTSDDIIIEKQQQDMTTSA